MKASPAGSRKERAGGAAEFAGPVPLSWLLGGNKERGAAGAGRFTVAAVASIGGSRRPDFLAVERPAVKGQAGVPSSTRLTT